MIKKGILLLMFVTLLMLPMTVQAKTTYRYVTKTEDMKEQPKKKAKTIEKLKCNYKVILIKKGKTWSKIQFAEQFGYVKTNALHEKRSPKKYPPKYFKRRGVIRWGGCKWTWYTTKRHPDRRNSLGIKGKHIDKKYGYVLDKDGYICLASSIRNKKKHLIVPTPFGRYGKVYDTNGKGPSNWRDVYTNW